MPCLLFFFSCACRIVVCHSNRRAIEKETVFYSIFESAFSIISAREKKTGWNVNLVRYRKCSYIFRVRSEGGRVKIHTGREEEGSFEFRFTRVAKRRNGKKGNEFDDFPLGALRTMQ